MIEPMESVLAALRLSGAAEDAAAARFRRRAADEGLVDVAYSVLDSPLGPLLAAATPLGLARLAYLAEGAVDQELQALATRLSPRVLEVPEALDGVRRELDEYFEGSRRSFSLTVDPVLMGGFARLVLQRTAAIPYGARATYRDLARAVDRPGAARAVGNALGSNPVPIVIPCHRVLRTGGALGGYTGGIERKSHLLRLEAAGASSGGPAGRSG